MKGNAIFHYIRYLFGFDKANTQTTLAERKIMLHYVAMSELIIEIGVFEGFNTMEFALFSPDKTKVFAIDPFFKGMLGFNYGKSIAVNEWKKNKVAHKINVVEGYSWDVIKILPNNVDFIFIDGDHSFEGVLKDFNLYSELLSANGIIALHDARIFDGGWTNYDWGPVRLVEEIIKPSGNWEIINEIDSLVLIRKKII
jgi:hypothetical protein